MILPLLCFCSSDLHLGFGVQLLKLIKVAYKPGPFKPSTLLA
uniref:Uncharacterized protein n=1 Tax=Anguilla anguilla TaxID=7936 RepID=A0A0E9S734_ANGAN